MSRVPRTQEFLKTGFTAEAVSAAKCRANAVMAEEKQMPNLAARWRDLALLKDELAIQQLRAAGQILDPATSLRDTLAEDRYEIEVLYPRMMRDADKKGAEVFAEIIDAQRRHLAVLEEMSEELQAARADLSST